MRYHTYLCIIPVVESHIGHKSQWHRDYRRNSHAQQSSLIQQRIGKKAITAYQVKVRCFPTNQKKKRSFLSGQEKAGIGQIRANARQVRADMKDMHNPSRQHRMKSGSGLNNPGR
jgi:hypothetical protein